MSEEIKKEFVKTVEQVSMTDDQIEIAKLISSYVNLKFESLQSENKRLREQLQYRVDEIVDHKMRYLDLKEELEEAIRILKFLTELRDHKVINGKDDFYNNNRHLAWYDADMLLSKHKDL